MFVWERSSSQLSRELLEHRDNANTNAPAVHTSRSVSVFAVFVIPVPWCWGTAAIRLRLNLSSRSLWVRALCCSYLPPRGLMLLALLWMNWVLAIPIFYIWKARFPALAILRGGDGRDLCVVCFGAEHTHTHTLSALESYLCSSFNPKCTSENVLPWTSASQNPDPEGIQSGPTSISYFKSTNYISYFGKRMLNL